MEELLRELVETVQVFLDNPPCMDYDCCEVAFAHEAARTDLVEVMERVKLRVP